VEPDKKTEEEESVDDKEKDSTPDPSPDIKNKTKPIAGELYRGHVEITCSVYTSRNNSLLW